MLRQLLSGTAVALLVAAGPAVAQSTDEYQIQDTEQMQGTEPTGEAGVSSTEGKGDMEAEAPADTALDEPTGSGGGMSGEDTASAETFFTEQAEDETLASELIGVNVQNGEGEILGSINDVLITEADGVKGVVIGVGGFLGLGQKNVAVNYAQIEQNRDEYGNVTLVFSATADQLEEAPNFMNLQQKIAEAEAEASAQQGTQPPAQAE